MKKNQTNPKRSWFIKEVAGLFKNVNIIKVQTKQKGRDNILNREQKSWQPNVLFEPWLEFLSQKSYKGYFLGNWENVEITVVI